MPGRRPKVRGKAGEPPFLPLLGDGEARRAQRELPPPPRSLAASRRARAPAAAKLQALYAPGPHRGKTTRGSASPASLRVLRASGLAPRTKKRVPAPVAAITSSIGQNHPVIVKASLPGRCV